MSIFDDDVFCPRCGLMGCSCPTQAAAPYAAPALTAPVRPAQASRCADCTALLDADGTCHACNWRPLNPEVQNQYDPKVWARMVADRQRRYDAAVATRTTPAEEEAPKLPARAAPLNWSTFLHREMGEVDFVVGRIMARGEHIALVGDGKAGKSLFTQEWTWRMAAGLEFLGDGPRPPMRVLYVDQENSEDEIQERFLALGATAETLTNLIYLSFPLFEPLNTATGASQLLAVVDEHKPAVVVFDTISRMVKGKENDSEPWLELYRQLLMRLKAKKVSSIRLDHFGKDTTRGSRGNSAKTQDVDGVWELVPAERGSSLLQLRRTHTRTGKGSGDLLLRRHGELIGDRWKPGATWHGLADDSEMPERVPDAAKQYKPSTQRVLSILLKAQALMTVRQLGDVLAAEKGGPLTARTIQMALQELSDAGLVDEIVEGKGKAGQWMVTSRA